MKTSFIYNFLISQLILIKFTLKLFVYKCLSFQTHLILDVCFHNFLCGHEQMFVDLGSRVISWRGTIYMETMCCVLEQDTLSSA